MKNNKFTHCFQLLLMAITDKLRPIMYIEDDPDDVDLFNSVLAGMKVDNPVISFWNGEEAWKYLLSPHVKPFIIFCDVNMPVMNGFQLRQQIKENKAIERSCIPFIFYSTNADKQFVDMAYTLTIQ